MQYAMFGATESARLIPYTCWLILIFPRSFLRNEKDAINSLYKIGFGHFSFGKIQDENQLFSLEENEIIDHQFFFSCGSIADSKYHPLCDTHFNQTHI